MTTIPVTDLKTDMNADIVAQLEKLQQRITELETENRHLTNELRLVEEEKEAARKSYFDMIGHMEEKVAQRTHETKELQKISEARSKELQTMVDVSPAMIFFKDSEQRYIRINRQFANSLGLPPNRIIGKTFSELFPNSTNETLKDDIEVMQSGKPVVNVPAMVTTRKGLRQILITKVPSKDFNGNINGLIGFAVDITELRATEQEKRELEDRLAQLEKMEAVGRLAGGVAHDLNNVLSAVVSYPDLILMKLPENSPFRKPIETMQSSGKKAAAIVEDLLTLARRSVPVTEVVNLNDLITHYLVSPEFEILQSYNPLVHIQTQLSEDLACIMGSSLHLTKTLMNLVSNAAEATMRQGTITISTSNRYLERPVMSCDLRVPVGSYVVLTVTDTGIGISPQDLKKIFEPFYTKKVMGRSGTGLGMAVVWGTVKDHKGNIVAKSVEGQGTTFELFFPATSENTAKKKAFIPIKTYMGHQEHILIVDDVLEQREIATTLLENLNYRVNAVENGTAAIAFLTTVTVDLVILDMIMDPCIDGLETYRQIIEIHPGQKAIITSGFSETERVKEAQRLGAGAYVRKPYNLETIGMAIKKELEK